MTSINAIKNHNNIRPYSSHLPKWIKAKLFTQISGWSKDAIDAKRKRGIWLEDTHWKKAPDGNIMINHSAIDEWVESNGA